MQATDLLETLAQLQGLARRPASSIDISAFREQIRTPELLVRGVTSDFVLVFLFCTKLRKPWSREQIAPPFRAPPPAARHHMIGCT